MTKTDLQGHKIGEIVQHPAWKPMLDFITESIPRPTAGRDATTVITDEGFTRGVLWVLDVLRDIHRTPEPVKREQVQMYQDPSTRKSDLNK